MENPRHLKEILRSLGSIGLTEYPEAAFGFESRFFHRSVFTSQSPIVAAATIPKKILHFLGPPLKS